MADIQIRETGDFDRFAAEYGEEWRRIAEASDRATVFQTWEWIAAWWEHHRAGKRFRGLVFQADGVTVGMAALYGSVLPSPLRTWRFVGTGGSDYLDLIALPGYEAGVANAFRDALAARAGKWDWVDLQQVRPGAVAGALTEVAEDGASRAVRAKGWQGETCPYLPLGADWEATRKAFGKKLRGNIGYYGRALEKGYQVEYRTATAETLEDDLLAFFDLHQRRWNQRWMPGAFASRRERAFHTDAARRLLAADYLRLHTLTLDGEIQAALYCFQKGRVCYYYLGGFEPKFARLSVGTVLTAYAIRQAIERDGATEFDFLRGDEGYKYKWGALDRFNRRLSITHDGLRPLVLAGAGRAQLTVEQALKAYMHRRHGGGGQSGQKRADVDA